MSSAVARRSVPIARTSLLFELEPDEIGRPRRSPDDAAPLDKDRSDVFDSLRHTCLDGWRAWTTMWLSESTKPIAAEADKKTSRAD